MIFRYSICSLLLAACGSSPIIVRPPPEEDCEAACLHLEALECVEADPTPGPDGALGTADDGTCVAICENAKAELQGLNSKCVANVKSCAEVDRCQQ